MRQEALSWGGVVGGGADLRMPAARQFTMCNTCLSAPPVPLCTSLPPPLAIEMTELFISCARMIDRSYLKSLFVFHRCMSSFILPADKRTHGGFRHSAPPIATWHADGIKEEIFPMQLWQKIKVMMTACVPQKDNNAIKGVGMKSRLQQKEKNSPNAVAGASR